MATVTRGAGPWADEQREAPQLVSGDRVVLTTPRCAWNCSKTIFVTNSVLFMSLSMSVLAICFFFWVLSTASEIQDILSQECRIQNQEGCESKAMWLAVLSKTSGQHLERRHEAGSYHPICSGRDKSPASTPATSSAQAANIKITPMYAISDLCDPRLF